jgi:hypothetical protein
MKDLKQQEKMLIFVIKAFTKILHNIENCGRYSKKILLQKKRKRRRRMEKENEDYYLYFIY